MNADGFRFICVYLCPSAVNILVQNARTDGKIPAALLKAAFKIDAG
jgi:hypothetical protein